MADKSTNYTVEMEARLREAYEADPTRKTVDMLAEEMGKSYRSVISKLSTMGIYQAPPRTTKAGQPIVKKEALANDIMERLAVSVPSLVKVNKQDLIRLKKAIKKVTE